MYKFVFSASPIDQTSLKASQECFPEASNLLSEIRLNKKIQHQTTGQRFLLYHSSSFLFKKQMEKDGPESLASVVKLHFGPDSRQALTEDRGCLVRALHYYFDITKSL